MLRQTRAGWGDPVNLELLDGADWLGDRNGVSMDGASGYLKSADAAFIRARDLKFVAEA